MHVYSLGSSSSCHGVNTHFCASCCQPAVALIERILGGLGAQAGRESSLTINVTDDFWTIRRDLDWLFGVNDLQL